jgi:hypothetical protein
VQKPQAAGPQRRSVQLRTTLSSMLEYLSVFPPALDVGFAVLWCSGWTVGQTKDGFGWCGDRRAGQ